jgi:hypothetical protein
MTRVRTKAIMVAITNAHKLHTNIILKSEQHERNYSAQFFCGHCFKVFTNNIHFASIYNKGYHQRTFLNFFSDMKLHFQIRLAVGHSF